jgi:tetratricopeptide (TPR) repeat protein
MSNNFAKLAMAKRAEGRIEEAIQDFQKSLNIAEEINNPLGVARQRDNLAEIYFAVHRIQEAVADGEAAFRVARELGTPREQCFHGLTYGWALIAANELEEARTVLSHAAQQNVPQANHQALVALGVACLRAYDDEAAHTAFQEAIQRADTLIERSPRYYKGWLTKGLAQVGLTLQQQMPIETAVESYQRACEIAPHAGVVRRQLRLLEELKVVDSKQALSGVHTLLQHYLQKATN